MQAFGSQEVTKQSAKILGLMQMICFGKFNTFSTCKKVYLLLKFSYNSTVSAEKGEDKDLHLVPHLQNKQGVCHFVAWATLYSPMTVPKIE